MSYLLNFLGGIKQGPVGTLFIQTATGTIANSTTETAISSTGVGSLVLPAGFFVAGRSLRISARGIRSNLLTPTMRLKLKFGSTAILDTGAIASITETNGLITFDGLITCRTTGGSGTVFSQGAYGQIGLTPTLSQIVSTGTVTVDTTASQTISLTATWGVANALNTISLTNFIVESIST